MFDNISGKIKTFATIVACLGMIASVAGGLALMIANAVTAGFLMAGFGALFSWAGSFALYGLGELIESNNEIVKLLKQENISANPIYEGGKHVRAASVAQAREDMDEKPLPVVTEGWTCEKCNTVNSMSSWVCRKCGLVYGWRCKKCKVMNPHSAIICRDCGREKE